MDLEHSDSRYFKINLPNFRQKEGQLIGGKIAELGMQGFGVACAISAGVKDFDLRKGIIDGFVPKFIGEIFLDNPTMSMDFRGAIGNTRIKLLYVLGSALWENARRVDQEDVRRLINS